MNLKKKKYFSNFEGFDECMYGTCGVQYLQQVYASSHVRHERHDPHDAFGYVMCHDGQDLMEVPLFQ